MRNQFLKAFLIVSFSFSLILGYEALYPHFPILHKFKTSHFFTPYKSTTETTDVDSDLALLSDSTMTDSTNIGPDSIYSGFRDYIQQQNISLSKEDSLALLNLGEYTGLDHLKVFFEKLQELKQGKRKKVRIAYFGDSTTEGDLIVSDIRSLLQKIFGGRGVGFVPIAPVSENFRQTIRQKSSDSWGINSYIKKSANLSFPLGISGDYGFPKSNNANIACKISFNASGNNYINTNSFDIVNLYYGKYQGEEQKEFPTLNVKIDKKDSLKFQLDEGKLVNKLNFLNRKSNQLDLEFNFSAPFPVYGLSFESENGIIIDNLSKRGDSGMNFGKISPEVLKLFYEYLGFDLIVLHFGANVLTERTDYTFYEKSLLNSIFHFKKSMNNIPVMIIGSSDRVIKSEGREMTNPAVYGLMKAQRMAAVKTKTAYFDLFEKMGGSGSMIQWAKSNPQKASSDFVHFSGIGSKEIARYIYDFLIQGYFNQTGDQLNNKK